MFGSLTGLQETTLLKTSLLKAGRFPAVGLLTLCLLCSCSRPSQTRLEYFSEDDGATFYTAPLTQPPYVAPDGKPAVLAAVFSCDGGRTKFVGYLMRSAAAPVEAASQTKMSPLGFGPIEVKKPGPNQPWVASPAMVPEVNGARLTPEQQAYADVVNVTGPPGSGHPLRCKAGE
jgi:hypothetical protein